MTKAKRLIISVQKPKGKPRNPPGVTPPALEPYIYKPGHPKIPGSGRKAGALGGKTISESAALYLKDMAPDDVRELLGLEENATWADAVNVARLRMAVGLPTAANLQAAKEMREETEGKLPDRFEASGPGGTPLTGPTFSLMFIKPGEAKPDAVKVPDQVEGR